MILSQLGLAIPTPTWLHAGTLPHACIHTRTHARAHTHTHRFNKAADLLNEVVNGYYTDLDVSDAFSRIFVWLRYSSTRKLTWQRNYNTQPRILSAAQERLTNTIASTHSRMSGEAQVCACVCVYVLLSHSPWAIFCVCSGGGGLGGEVCARAGSCCRGGDAAAC